MNKQRRNEIEKVLAKVSECIETTQSLLDEEQDGLSNLPFQLQDSEKGEKMQDAIDNLSDAIDSLNEAMEYLSKAGE